MALGLHDAAVPHETRQWASLSSPCNLQAHHFPVPEQLADICHLPCRGGRMDSESWGTDSPVYDALAYDLDLFTYLFQVCPWHGSPDVLRFMALGAVLGLAEASTSAGRKG